MISAKEIARRTLSRGVVLSGMSGAFRRFRRSGGALILYGHRLSSNDEGYLQGLSPEWFGEQLAYLTRHLTPLSLADLVRCYEEGGSIPQRAMVLTFDDGFRDNLIHGVPLLEKYGLPATVFVVTRSITTGELPWSQRLGYLFQHTTRRRIAANFEGGGPLFLETASDRRQAYLAVKGRFRSWPQSHRDEEIGRLSEELGVAPPKDRMLSWADLEDMQRRGIEIGAHTYSHPYLARLPLEEARHEMQRSLDDLKERLGIDRPFFCFPAGCVNAELIELAREIGFRGTFRSSRRRRFNNLETSDQFGLSRVGLPNAPGYVLEAEIDGPFHTLRSLYWG